MAPPLGLAYLKASLRAEGLESLAIDFTPEVRPTMLSAMGDKQGTVAVLEQQGLLNSWAMRILKHQPRVVGFSIYETNYEITRAVALRIRQLSPGTVIVCGGNGFTREQMWNIRRTFEFSDYVFEGEGETAFPQFVRALIRDGRPDGVKQLWTLGAGGEPQFSGMGPQADLNSIPLPDMEDFDFSKYRVPHMLPMLFSRGCILNCAYCTYKWNFRTQRTRTGRNVFEEFKSQVKKYPVTQYTFNDDSLISYVTYKELETFCDLAVAEGLVLPWSIYGTRVERLLNDAYVAKLRRSGLQRVQLGVESFSSAVQKNMGKSGTKELADRTVRLFAENGVRTGIWVIYGYPAETEEDFRDTLDWLRQHGHLLSHASVNVFGPNQKYMESKAGAGVVQYHSERWWNWSGASSNLDIRCNRFIRLVEVLEELRLSSTREFDYMIGDPFYGKFYRKWSLADVADFKRCHLANVHSERSNRSAEALRSV